MTCRDLSCLLLDYLSSDLDAATRQQIEQHLSRCLFCIAYLRSYQKTICLARVVMSDPGDDQRLTVPDDVVARVLVAWQQSPS